MKFDRIKLSALQRQELLDGLKLESAKANSFCKEAELAISVYRRSRQHRVSTEPEVKRRLTKLQKTLDAARKLIDCLLSDTETSKANRQEVRRQIARNLTGAIPMGVLTGFLDDKGRDPFARFVRTAKDLLELEQASRKALAARPSKAGGRGKNNAARLFVSKLAEIYEKATGTRAGIGQNTRFYRVVQRCFGFAGHQINDPINYIRPVLHERRK